MQYRQLPPAGTLDDIVRVLRAVPRDPAETDDCCARICERTGVETREHASSWLVFLTALCCVNDDGNGYYRLHGPDVPVDDTGDSLAVDRLGDRFESRMLGVQPVLETLRSAESPLTSEEISDRLDVGTRRRIRRADPAYLDRMLAWAVVFDHVATVDGRYTIATE